MPDKLLPIQLVFDHWKGNKGQKLESNKEIEENDVHCKYCGTWYDETKKKDKKD